MINYDALIHNRSYFTLEHIKAQQQQYNFTQAVKVETFLWDLELYGQLQRQLEEKVILKGGAAAQLFFSPERQRTSVDIDVIYIGEKEELYKALASIHKAFGEDDTFFKFVAYTPKNPQTIIPMETYYVTVPSLTHIKGELHIKIDFHFAERMDLEIVELASANAFVLPLAFKPRCLSLGSLLGDKLLTFARGSVGIPVEREDDIIKQLYDVDLLSRRITHQEIDTVLNSMAIHFEKESKIREERVELRVALNQMIDLLEIYSQVNSPKCDPAIKKVVYNFRGNYEPPPFRNWLEWEILAKRLQFLVRAIEENPGQSLVMLKEAEDIERMIAFDGDQNKGELRKLLASEFTQIIIANGQPNIAKQLKNTLPERIYWEIVRPSNLSSIRKMIDNII